ncbi:MAG: hypothetical protein QOE31_138 [Solirubrobacteraceae bacterium]|jgi:hypothetical protein|nr:hypothetical protein [Solirubrobacteraceae bacterium]
MTVVRLDRAAPALPARPCGAFDRADARRLAAGLEQAAEAAAGDVVDLLPPVGAPAERVLRRSCAFAHRALLLFPSDLPAATADLRARGLEPTRPLPSVVVRRRLCARHRLDHAACDVSVVRVRALGAPADGYHLELFLFARSAAALTPSIVHSERTWRFEDHVALEVGGADEAALERIVILLQQQAGLLFEGGGHNPHEGPAGSTVLYFVGETRPRGITAAPPFRRYELYCSGDRSSLLARHAVDRAAVARTYSRWAAAA